MTSDMQQPLDGPRRAAPGLGGPDGTAGPQRSTGPGIVGFVPLLAVLALVVVGVYVAWDRGSAGGGAGGVLAGAALLAGAAARLFLPVRLAGLLAVRKRSTDVITLAAFGAALLTAGLTLPH